MRQVFLNRPWVHPAEPEPLAQIFKRLGRARKLPKGHLFTHGGESGDVSLVTKGLVFFSFPDAEDKDRVFGIIPPGRVVGDLDAVTEFHLNVNFLKFDNSKQFFDTENFRTSMNFL